MDHLSGLKCNNGVRKEGSRFKFELNLSFWLLDRNKNITRVEQIADPTHPRCARLSYRITDYSAGGGAAA